MSIPSNRILYNRDCQFLFGDSFLRFSESDEPLSVEIIHRWVEAIAKSGADTLVINPNTQVAAYPSRIFPTLLGGYTRGDREYVSRHCAVFPTQSQDAMCAYLDRMLDLKEADVDWLEETSKACHGNGLVPWLSVRMNDTHSVVDPENRLDSGLLKEEGYQLSGVDIIPGNGVRDSLHSTVGDWRGLNFALKPVRDHYFALIRELVQEYDYEGMELDWTRSPLCCEPNCPQEEIDLLTQWTGEIRELTLRKAQKTGRPYYLGIRTPGNLRFMKSLGLDIRSMAEREYIDFICPTNHFQASYEMPIDSLKKELGSNVAVYGVIENLFNTLSVYSTALGQETGGGWGGRNWISGCPEMVYGNAAALLALGADGIEAFNFFVLDEGRGERYGMKENYSILKGVDDLVFLRGRRKMYGLSRPFFLHEQTEQVPVSLDPGLRRGFSISMCGEPPEGNLRLTIQVVLAATAETPRLGVSFNGGWPWFSGEWTDRLLVTNGLVDCHTDRYRACNFFFDAGEIKEGWNQIIVYNDSYLNKANSAKTIRIEEIELLVDSNL